MKRSRQRLPWIVSLVLGGMLLGGEIPSFAESSKHANGKKLYLTYCFTCHGTKGKGEGYAASVQPTKPRNLTDDTYMSSRTRQQLFDAISGGGHSVGKSMTMPYWRESLTEDQIWSLVAYIRTLHQKPPAGKASNGATVYAMYCWTCHGKQGQGDGPIAKAYAPRPKNLQDAATMAGRTDYELYDAISLGGTAVGRSAAMPAWGQALTSQEIWDLVAYLRQLSKRP